MQTLLGGMNVIKSNFFVRHKKGLIIGGIVLTTAVVGTIIYFNVFKKSGFDKFREAMATTEYTEAKSGDISLTITGSGAITSSNTKNISSEVSAKVKQVNIEVGDKVNKGDVLFVLDSSNLDSQIRSKEKSISTYQKSINDYNKDIKNLNVTSTTNGYVQNLKVGVGDSVNKNDVVFEVTDNSVYQVVTNMYYFESNPINVGDIAKMMLSDSYVYVEGTVVEVSDLKEQHERGGQMQKVTIEINNPGYTLEGIEVRDVEVTTQNGSIVVAVKEDTIQIKLKDSVKFRSPSSGKVTSINVSNGSYITSGMLIMTLENDDLKDKVSDLSSSISDTYTDLSDMRNDYDFYTITSPIDGVVTTLNVSEGDYIRSEGSMATIVNTDKLQFEISVDELDILQLEEGQEAKITIEAIEETERTPIIGYVSEIGIVGTNMNNVTSYPVTITLDGREDIMIGMNCNVEIVVKSSKNVLTIPVEAVSSRRGKYYVTLENGTEKEVTIGIYDEDNIEIKSGLNAGDKVKLPSKVIATSSETEKAQESFGGFMGGGSMPSGGFPGGGSGGFPDGGSRPSSSNGSRSSSSSSTGSRGGFSAK